MRPLWLIITLITMLLAACNRDNAAPQLSLDRYEVEIASEGGEVEVRVMSNAPWEMTGYTSWCEPSTKSGQGSASGEVVLFRAERADNDRSITYTFRSGSAVQQLRISQRMLPDLTTDNKSTHWVMPEGGRVVFNYQTNVDCEIVIPAEAEEWLMGDTRALGKHRAEVEVAANTTGRSREATVVVRSVEEPTMELRFTVHQPSDTNIIRYTTTDGNIFEPADGAFNAAITNNLYLDSGGVIEFDDSVTAIRDQAFYLAYFNNLKSITLPDTVESIGDATFYQCLLLEDVTLPSSLRTIGASAFAECVSLTDIVIPDGVQVVGDGAFRWCDELRSVTMSDSVTSLGALCFEECKALVRVRLSDNITSIQNSTLFGCISLQELNIPSKLEAVECYAFCGCTLLPDITLPDGLRSIDGYAFMSCHAFTEIDIPEGVTSMGDNCLGDCPNLRRVTLPESLEVLGANALFGCALLREVNIPEGITELCSGLFQGCESLESVVLPSRLKTVGDFAFEGCTSLTEIDLPATVTHVNQSAFAYCYSLERAVVRNEHLKQIQGSAFAYCPSLTRLELHSVEPPQLPELNIFDGCGEMVGVYVPTESLEAYRCDAAWSTYADYLRPLE